MTYPVDTPARLRAVIKALRQSRGLSQAALGARLGVNQKRIARIESAPGVTSFDQITRLFAVLGARIVIDDTAGLVAKTGDVAPTDAAKTRRRSTTTAPKTREENW